MSQKRAILDLLAKHPDWTVEQIAVGANCKRQEVYRCARMLGHRFPKNSKLHRTQGEIAVRENRGAYIPTTALNSMSLDHLPRLAYRVVGNTIVLSPVEATV